MNVADEKLLLLGLFGWVLVWAAVGIVAAFWTVFH